MKPGAMALLFVAVTTAGERADELLVQLVDIRRVYVDRLGGGEVAGHIRDMVINGLQRSGLYVVTENQDRADAILRGSAEDLVFTDTFQSSDGVRLQASAGDGGTSSRSGSRDRRYASVSVGDEESRRIAERKHEAAAAVRLVNREGDVIWATTQESFGAKFRGASVDVADKITRQLLDDYERARKLKGVSSPSRGPASAATTPQR
jgi:hypothetical protein